MQGKGESLCSCLVGWFGEGLEQPFYFSWGGWGGGGVVSGFGGTLLLFDFGIIA